MIAPAAVDQVEADELAVERTMNELVESYFTQDIKRLMHLYPSDSDLVLLGSMAHERCIGPGQIRALYIRDFAKNGPVRLEPIWTTSSVRSQVAWFAGEYTVHAGEKNETQEFRARLTAVLENRHDHWLIVQQHFSVPALL